MDEEIKKILEENTAMMADIVLRLSALERVLKKKNLIKLEDVEAELKSMGSELAGFIHLALQADQDKESAE
jgi:hypothetical protein